MPKRVSNWSDVWLHWLLPKRRLISAYWQCKKSQGPKAKTNISALGRDPCVKEVRIVPCFSFFFPCAWKNSANIMHHRSLRISAAESLNLDPRSTFGGSANQLMPQNHQLQSEESMALTSKGFLPWTSSSKQCLQTISNTFHFQILPGRPYAKFPNSVPDKILWQFQDFSKVQEQISRIFSSFARFFSNDLLLMCIHHKNLCSNPAKRFQSPMLSRHIWDKKIRFPTCMFPPNQKFRE